MGRLHQVNEGFVTRTATMKAIALMLREQLANWTTAGAVGGYLSSTVAPASSS